MKRFISKSQITFGKVFILTSFAAIVAACSSSPALVESESSNAYQVKFKSDYNMKYTDTFHSDVNSVTLYAFDENGNFVTQKTDAGDQLKSNDYSMKLNIDPSKYHLVVWGDLDANSYSAPVLTPGVSKITDLQVQVNKGSDASFVNQKLASLYHGEANLHNAVSRSGDTIIIVPLWLSSNEIDIVVAMVDASSRAPFDNSKFSFDLTDNSSLNYDNTSVANSSVTYQPYMMADSTISSRALSRSYNVLYSSVVAKFSLLRLLLSNSPTLNIRYNGKPLLLKCNLMKYFLLLETYKLLSMPLQEYLDRQNKFVITFFVNKDMNIVSSTILINGITINM